MVVLQCLYFCHPVMSNSPTTNGLLIGGTSECSCSIRLHESAHVSMLMQLVEAPLPDLSRALVLTSEKVITNVF